MAKRIINLYDALMQACGDEQNPELKNWAKFVYGVDYEQYGGWMYVGDFVRSGTSEVEMKPTVFIVLSTGGTEIDPKPIYRVVVMDGEGNFFPTRVATEGTRPGWAMRLRDDVTQLLAEIEVADIIMRINREGELPEDELDSLEIAAVVAMETGDDVMVPPNIMLALLDQYREKMRL